MSTNVMEAPRIVAPTAGIVAIRRPVIDRILIGFGVVVAVVFAVSGGLLTWGHNFSTNYVGDELGSQNISFPPAAALTEDGRQDLLKYAGASVNTGREAQAYASFIDGHLQKIAGGKTYADLGVPESAAKAEVQAAVKAGADQSEIDVLQAKADGFTNQRNTLFKGETLRGLLLSAYAWATVGSIAGIAAIGAFIAAAGMMILVALGLVHVGRSKKTTA